MTNERLSLMYDRVGLDRYVLVLIMLYYCFAAFIVKHASVVWRWPIEMGTMRPATTTTKSAIEVTHAMAQSRHADIEQSSVRSGTNGILDWKHGHPLNPCICCVVLSVWLNVRTVGVLINEGNGQGSASHLTHDLVPCTSLSCFFSISLIIIVVQTADVLSAS